MNIGLNLSADYTVFDGLSTVQYAAPVKPEKNEVGAAWTRGTAATIRSARVEKISRHEVQTSDGVYTALMTNIRLPAALTVTQPKIGGVLVDADSNVWTILQVGHPRFGNSWSCQCLTLELDATLSDTVTWRKADVSNVKGSKITIWADQETGLAARIQVLSAAEISIQGKLGFDVDYAIFLEKDIEATFGDLIHDETTGLDYEIKSYTGRKSLQDLTRLLAKRRP